MMRKLLVILGPTATGKTDLALNLAKKFNGELVSCDSRQVYVGLDIGSGKLPSGRWKIEDGRWKKSEGFWEIDGVNIWMYDVVDSRNQYTVADYVRDANKVINEIQKRKKLPIVVGGSGLYLKALLYGLPNLAIPIDIKFRKVLKKLSLQKLQNKLQILSPEKWVKMNNSDRQNSRRLTRAIEILLNTTKSTHNINATTASLMLSEILKIGLTAPRKILYQRIDERVVDRVNQGMIGEAKKLHKNGLNIKRMKQLGLEYGVLADYLGGEIKGTDELIKIMQGKIHGFVRRQLTWFKKERESSWFDISKKDFNLDVEKIITRWYYQD